jgi:hypothetical protein
MSNNSNSLPDKIDEFIKKYYFNQLIKGFLLSIGLLLAFFILAVVLEYFGQFSSVIRTILFFSYLSFAALILMFNIFKPLLKLFKIGSHISHVDASKIIGQHFPDIKDKLLNTLQLQAQLSHSESELLIASIQQRIQVFKPISFTAAINLKESFKKYGRYALLPLSLVIVLLVFQSNVITKSTGRLLHYNREYKKEAPFQMILLSKELRVNKHQDFLIELDLKGKNIPEEMFVVLDGHDIKMESSGGNRFSYKLTNVMQSKQFSFTDGEFSSEEYQLTVVPNPSLLNFNVKLSYPSYTGKPSETLKNIGDFTVPEGTSVTWYFNTKEVDTLRFLFPPTTQNAEQNDQSFSLKKAIRKATTYTLIPINNAVKPKDSVKYTIQVIEDKRPNIFVEQKQDSINPFVYYFYGKVEDDYGLNKLVFHLKSNQQKTEQVPVKIGKSSDEVFYMMVDFRNYISKEGEQFEYYFEVWDNDAVNGSKSTKSPVFTNVTPTTTSLKADADQSQQSLKNSMKQSMKQALELQKKSQSLNKMLMEKNQLEWQDQKQFKEFIEEQKKLQEQLDKIQKDNQLNQLKEQQLKPLDEELLEKQKEIDKLFKELMSPEMKDLLKKLEEALKKQNKEQIQQQLEKMNLNNEDMKKQLDRTLEQFKQLELEKKINDQVNELKELAKEQEKLSEEALDKKQSQEKLKEKQDEISKKFEEIKENLKSIEEKNKALEQPMNLDATDKEEQQIQESLKESEQSLDKKQNKKASEKQKEAAEKMEELAEKMKKSLEKSQEQQEEEDYYTLRQLLENLIELSHQQEDLMQQLKAIRGYSPKFVQLSDRQRAIKMDAKMIEDSLLTLSKRQVHIKSFVNKELSKINYQMDKSIGHLSKIETNPATASQQYVMTGFNNLSVMLSESLKKMQEDMNEKKSKKQKSGQCNNPGSKPGNKPGEKGDPKMSGMKKMQDALNKQLKDMKDGKQMGTSPTSEQFAKIAAQQEALRRQLGKLEQQLKEQGKAGSLGELDKTKQLMEQQENDLVNKRLTNETMQRMKEIETRMLEHEKAEREQDQDEERQGEQAQKVETTIPPAIKNYLEQKTKEMEQMRKVPNELTPYYKERVRQYFNKVGKI